MAIVHGPLAAKQSRPLLGSVGTSLSILVAMGLVTAALFLPVAQSSGATTTGYTIRRHQQELADLNADIYNMQAEIAQLGSLSRIRSEAQRLGMTAPQGAAVSVRAEAPLDSDVRLPRQYLPLAPASEPENPVVHHDRVWTVLHAVHLR